METVDQTDSYLKQSVSQLARQVNGLLKGISTQFNAKDAIHSEHIDIANPHIHATVSRITLETHDTKSYFFQTAQPLNTYKAGAHINIQFNANGTKVDRTYTLSSSPTLAFKTEESNEFSITVKRVKEGLASNWLFENLNTGDEILVSQAQGQFVLPYQPAGKLLFLSAGSGVTPMMSMLRYLSMTGNKSDIVFLNYSQSKDDIIFHKELKQLTEHRSNMSSIFVLEKTDNEKLKGRINQQQLSQLIPDILEREIYLCGPQPFMKATSAILKEIDFQSSKLHLENFSADVSAASLFGYSAELSFASLEKAIQSSPSKTILEEAEAAGLNPAAACRTGICKTCRCKKTSGTILNLVTGEESSQAGEFILPCISVAKTATTIEL